MRLRAVSTIIVCLLVLPSTIDVPSASAQGVELERLTELQRDNLHISPPFVVGPLHACPVSAPAGATGAQVVIVEGVPLDALVQVYRTPPGGPRAALGPAVAADFTTIEVPLLTGLELGDLIEATTTLAGTTSAFSDPVEVVAYTDDYPGPLPVPAITPSIHTCGETLGSLGQIPGSELMVYRDGSSIPRLNIPSREHSQVYPPGRDVAPLTIQYSAGEALEVDYRFCGVSSALSDPREAVTWTAPLPSVVVSPEKITEGQEIVRVSNIIPSARVFFDLTPSGSGPVTPTPRISTAFSKSHGRPAAVLGRGLLPTDTLEIYQDLCTAGPPTTVDVLPCGHSDLPKSPRIAEPAVGDDEIVVLESVPGARIEVYDSSGLEIGDGAAPRIKLKRALGAETIDVRYVIGNCTTNWVYRISVDSCRPWTSIPDRGVSGDFDVATMDYAPAGRSVTVEAEDLTTMMLESLDVNVRGRVYYPTMMGTTTMAPGRHPIAYVIPGFSGWYVDPVDGIDSCMNTPGWSRIHSYHGYDYLLQALARNGWIAVSIDAEDLDCDGSTGMRVSVEPGPARAQLAAAHAELFNDADGSSTLLAGVFEDHLDSSNTLVVGHSVGGDAVMELTLSPSMMHGTIVGTVNIAGANFDPTKSLQREAYFAIVPADDNDIWTYASSYWYYSHRNQSDLSTYLNSYAFVADANHNFFNTEWPYEVEGGTSRLPRVDHEKLAASYIVEFGDEVIWGRESDFRSIARGELRVSGVARNNAGVDGERVYWVYDDSDHRSVSLYDFHPPGAACSGVPCTFVNPNNVKGAIRSDDSAAIISEFGQECRDGTEPPSTCSPWVGTASESLLATTAASPATFLLVHEGVPSSPDPRVILTPLPMTFDAESQHELSLLLTQNATVDVSPVDPSGMRVRVTARVGAPGGPVSDFLVSLAASGNRIAPRYDKANAPSQLVYSQVRVPTSCLSVPPDTELTVLGIALEAGGVPGSWWVDDVKWVLP